MIEIAKNAHERIRIDRHTYRGEDVVDLRVWVQGDKLDEMIPTRKGITFRADILPEVIHSLQDVLESNGQGQPTAEGKQGDDGADIGGRYGER